MTTSFINSFSLFRLLGLMSAAVICGGRLGADVVEIKNGARIIGQVSKIEGGSVVVVTDYAGTITIKQSEVSMISTDAPVAVRFANGTRIDGTMATAGEGKVKVGNSEGAFTAEISKVAASWAAGGRDPQIVALERGWAYESAVDASGKSGNRSQLGTALSLRATLAGAKDKLQFYTAYDRQVTDAQKSADQFKAGSDYQSNFSGKSSWYVRDEGGFDRIKDVELYNVAAVGMGYDLVKAPKQMLTGRFGLSFRYEGYKNPTTVDVKSAGLDFGFSHRFELGDSLIINRLAIVPAFQDIGNFRLTHESFYELPMSKPSWKLRLGLSNDYNSKPGRGVEKMDTGYFTRLVLSWK
jgi:putative salt-induced outer membrane protein YdiY